MRSYLFPIASRAPSRTASSSRTKRLALQPVSRFHETG